MAEEAPAQATTPAKAPGKPKRKSLSRGKSGGLGLPKLILAAVADSKDRKGLSVVKIKKVLAAKGIDVVKSNKRINLVIKSLVVKEKLIQVKGNGASGSFKLAKEAKAEKQKKKKEGPTTPKKKPTRKTKPAGAKKSPAKKKKLSAKKAGGKSSPKKPMKKKKQQVKKAAKKATKPAAKKSKPAAKPKPTAKKIQRVLVKKAAKKSGRKSGKK